MSIKKCNYLDSVRGTSLDLKLKSKQFLKNNVTNQREGISFLEGITTILVN